MLPMRKKFRVVKSNDPGAVFDDLDALRAAMPAVATKRARTSETFARFPHERALGLRGRIGADGWVLLVEIDRLILKGHGCNPVRLTNHRLRKLGISRSAKLRQLRKLEAAGVIRTKAEERKWTLVTHLWFPVQD